ncbi:MAG: hypothetical protein ABI047_01465, partial [Jatrophihabitantaceae bacterium]
SIATKWAAKVAPHFDFLKEHGFSRVNTDDSSFWSIWAQYSSDRAAVRISQSNEFRRAEVDLIRLTDGVVPPYPIWITSERIDWTLLDNVVEARLPSRIKESLSMAGLDAKRLDAQLAFWAQTLQDVAADFLAGDFAALDEAAEIVRERVREHPQQIVTWLPEDSPPDADEAALRDAAASVPPEVGVSVRRYRRGAEARQPATRLPAGLSSPRRRRWFGRPSK